MGNDLVARVNIPALHVVLVGATLQHRVRLDHNHVRALVLRGRVELVAHVGDGDERRRAAQRLRDGDARGEDGLRHDVGHVHLEPHEAQLPHGHRERPVVDAVVVGEQVVGAVVLEAAEVPEALGRVAESAHLFSIGQWVLSCKALLWVCFSILRWIKNGGISKDILRLRQW